MLYFANKEKLTSRFINIFLLFTLFFSILCSLLLIVLIKDVNTGAYFGRNVNTFKQLSHIFSNIFKFISMYLREIFSYDYTVIQLGYAEEVTYQKPPILVSILYYVAYGLSWLYQEKEYRVTKIDIKKFNLIQIGKIFSFFSIILSTFLILYLQFSLVGSDIIEGVKQRYFIAYSLLLLTFIPNIVKLKRPFLHGIVVVTYLPLVTYIIYFFIQIF